MATNTIRIHRVFRAEPEKVYRAFLAPRMNTLRAEMKVLRADWAKKVRAKAAARR